MLGTRVGGENRVRTRGHTPTGPQVWGHAAALPEFAGIPSLYQASKCKQAKKRKQASTGIPISFGDLIPVALLYPLYPDLPAPYPAPPGVFELYKS